MQSPPTVGAYTAAPVVEKTVLPEVTPMRRGRPTQSTPGKSSAAPSPSPRRMVASDPFAALDANKLNSGSNDDEDISKRFPSLDQFSLLHESGGTYAFDEKPQRMSQPRDISQRVTEALADEAFAVTPAPQTATATATATTLKTRPVSEVVSKISSGTQTLESPAAKQPLPKKSTMVSTGTMTSPRASTEESQEPVRSIWKVPQINNRSSSQPQTAIPLNTDLPERNPSLQPRPSLSEYRSQSQTATTATLKAPLSARPSLETRRPSATDLDDPLIRTRSDTARSRPVSAQFESATRFLRSRSPSQSKVTNPNPVYQFSDQDTARGDGEGARISSNVDFLRAMEEEEPSKRKEKRQSSGTKSGKRTSLPSISLSGTKNLLAGRFGDAFKRFEGGHSSEEPNDILDSSLTPITGSIATDGRSDDGQVLEETEEMPPEMRRELERRRLSQEERRVAEAAAAYKQRFSEGGQSSGRPRDSSRATLIQNKVQSLLVESSKPSPTKTAEGYGRFTHSPQPDSSIVSPTTVSTPSPSRKLFQQIPTSGSAPPTSSGPIPTQPLVSRPSAPPKPQVLRTGGSFASPSIAAKPSHLTGRSPQIPQVPTLTKAETTPVSPEDWEANFSKRYPSLSGLEMVETEIDRGGRVIRDV